MAYKVSKLRKDEYVIDFQFSKQRAKVNVEKREEDGRLVIYNPTDGYHWLQFWMAQEPNASKLLELPYEAEETKVRQSLAMRDFAYTSDDKRSFCLQSVNRTAWQSIEALAQYLEPRFALREKFFPDE